MRFIKLVFISVITLGILITAISGLFPSTVIVSRAIDIKSTPEKIAYYVADLHHWNIWMSDWKENTVLIKQDTAFVGAQIISLESKKANSVIYNWVATGQRPYVVTIEWIPLQDGTFVVHWSFEQHVKWYPWEKFQTLLNEKLLGSKMELELKNLQDAINGSVSSDSTRME